MKSRYVSALVVLIALCCVQTTEAQLLKKLQKKATDAVERKAEQKIDQKIEQMADRVVDSSFDAVFGGFEGGEGRMPFAIGADVTTEDRYTFNTVTTMEIESFKRDGKSEGKALMLMHFNEDAQYTGTQVTSEELKNSNSDVFIIYDLKNEAMVMLMSSEGSKFSMGYDWKEALKYAEEAAAAEGEDVNWDEVEEWNNYTKIGSKTIAGYACEGYRSDNEDATVEVWVSREVGLGMESMFGANMNSKQLKGKVPADYPAGMIMEMTSTDKKSGDNVVMRVTEINQRANVTYTMADYPMITLGQKK